MNVSLLRKFRAMAPKAARSSADSGGSFRRVVWYGTGIRRENPYTPWLKIGFEMDAPRLERPANGGDVAAGRWATVRPTGRMYLIWD